VCLAHHLEEQFGTVLVQSKHNPSTVQAQSKHNPSTVPAQSQHSPTAQAQLKISSGIRQLFSRHSTCMVQLSTTDCRRLNSLGRPTLVDAWSTMWSSTWSSTCKNGGVCAHERTVRCGNLNNANNSLVVCFTWRPLHEGRLVTSHVYFVSCVHFNASTSAPPHQHLCTSAPTHVRLRRNTCALPQQHTCTTTQHVCTSIPTRVRLSTNPCAHQHQRGNGMKGGDVATTNMQGGTGKIATTNMQGGTG
jgi:hypothetical protein